MQMDLHTHTWHSPDAAAEGVRARVERADALGLRVMAVTDHCEVNRYYDAAFYHATETAEFLYGDGKRLEASLAETTAEKAQGQCAVTLLCGAELGQMPQAAALAKRIYQDERLDVVIGSIHELPGRPDFFFLDYAAVDIPLLMTAYFDEVLRLARMDCYDVLGHLTYGLRYLPDRAAYDLTPHLPVIREIFAAVIAQGKAIECNGSGLRKEPSFTDPDETLLRLYREMGGQHLTLGTDAHATQDLGAQLATLEQMARAAGFLELTYFQKHQPQRLSLP